MKNTIGGIAWKIGIRKATINHFCKNFEINLENQIIKKIKTDFYLKNNFAKFLLENKEFLIKYEKDYYEDKTIKSISQEVNQHEKAIELFLKHYYPKYYEKGKFTPKKEYSLRYISSFFIDYTLGGNYEFLKFKNLE